ncbi:MAG: 3-deoxy-8-phosphooctulonate synthase [Syntrophales bacterium]|jgi:2-dehydro-3-deoxyphosphooctonate aldolase (KDO 8-P synthase)|nr:3-deoxy-8-phosphooctulonate synthase [Syntrophales bacterium]MDY0043292.1 3-deoxy-8-phosphooctulonate synthase [Syntrophales bacterium]
MPAFDIHDFTIGNGNPFVLIAGPCVIENYEIVMQTAKYLRDLTSNIGIPFIFKSSYDKANRSSKDSFRGPGLAEGIEIMAHVKKMLGVPILSDVHRFEEIDSAAKVFDILQIPAFLCRQSDFVAEVAKKASVVNIKKGQFLAPGDVSHVLKKALAAGNEKIMITERGYTFGYNNLVADMRSLAIMRKEGYPVIFDATHSVQLPGGLGTVSGGDREMAVCLARSAVACGIDGLFLEVHPNPDAALCDGPNSLELTALPNLLAILKKIDSIVKAEMYGTGQ